jgi:hypothetical protein
MSTVKGSTTISFVRQGDHLQACLMADIPLVQYLKKGTTTVMPDWTVASAQPTIYPVVRSSLSDTRISPIADTEEWKLGGVVIPFGTDGLSLAFGNIAAGMFKKSRKAMDGDTQVPCLTLCKNLVLMDAGNTRVEFSAQCNTGFLMGVTASIDIRLEEVDGDPYVGYISVNDGGVIDDNTETLTLTANLMRGGSAATGSITYRWFKASGNSWIDTGKTSKSITITGDDIATQELYRVEMSFLDTAVATATLPVYDERDPLIVVSNPDGEEVLSDTRKQIIYTPSVQRRGDVNRQALAGYSFSYMLTNSRADVIATHSGSSFTVTYAHGISAGGDMSLNITASK